MKWAAAAAVSADVTGDESAAGLDCDIESAAVDCDIEWLFEGVSAAASHE